MIKHLAGFWYDAAIFSGEAEIICSFLLCDGNSLWNLEIWYLNRTPNEWNQIKQFWSTKEKDIQNVPCIWTFNTFSMTHNDWLKGSEAH